MGIQFYIVIILVADFRGPLLLGQLEKFEKLLNDRLISQIQWKDERNTTEFLWKG